MNIEKEKHNEIGNLVEEFQNTQKLCSLLLESPHYRKMGPEGVFAIVEKAKSVGVSPMDALNGGMYFVQGKVEMTSSMMNQLIRASRHSITKDRKSDDTICILHGKRADNGDTWTEYFSIDDAKKAGLYRGQWLKYPKDMLFARALSRLARQLFPDVIKGCYVQGEIIADNDVVELEEKVLNSISETQYQDLEEALQGNDDLRKNILSYMNQMWGIQTLQEMPVMIYGSVMKRALNNNNQGEVA